MKSPVQAPLSIVVFTRFHPSVGGIETVAELLALEWAAAGHQVTIVTDLSAKHDDDKEFPFPVLHRPDPRELLKVIRSCDLVVHNNISLKAIWPLLVFRRPLVAVHHAYYDALGEGRRWRERLKLWMARHLAVNCSVSNAVREHVAAGGSVIPNAYDDCRFRARRQPSRRRLGIRRAVGVRQRCGHTFESLKRLRERGVRPTLLIAGEGPERTTLEAMASSFELTEQVTFLGHQSHDKLPQALNRCRLLVVPTTCHEGFGIVALEGLACGCVIVGSARGGLPEAIGPCGVTFPNGDDAALANMLEELLSDEPRLDSYRKAAPEHLAKHRADDVAGRYIEFFRSVLSR